MRSDLADVRLADRVFAPHYAAAMTRSLVSACALRAAPDRNSEILAQIAAGEPFDILDLSGGHAWGVEPRSGYVGYIDAAALGIITS